MIPNEPLPNYHHPHSSSRSFDRWSQINPSLGGTHYKALHPNLSFGDRSRLLKVIESQRSQKVKWFSMIMSSLPSFDSIFSTCLLLPALTTFNIVVWVFVVTNSWVWQILSNTIKSKSKYQLIGSYWLNQYRLPHQQRTLWLWTKTPSLSFWPLSHKYKGIPDPWEWPVWSLWQKYVKTMHWKPRCVFLNFQFP